MAHHLQILPEALRDSVRTVERRRLDGLAAWRRGDSFPPLSLSDRRAWLLEYHPDYRADGKRPLVVGASSGMTVPGELADVLESWPRPLVASFANQDAERVVDVLVIGGGAAGLCAAVAAAERGAQVLIATKLRHGDSNSIMAEGGIQAADQESDSPMQHYLDTMGGGHFINDPALVEALVTDGPAVLRWLETLGLLFDKYPTGRMRVRHGGGTSRKRVHSAGDVTGLELMRVLRDHVESLPGVTVVDFAPVVELLTDDNGRAAGALLERLIAPRRLLVVQAKAVVLATGGHGRLHMQQFPTSNHFGATADGLVMAYRAGLPLRDLQYNQYHPTGIAYPPAKHGLLITEKFRGMGAPLINRHGDAFVDSLESRDVITAAIIRECEEFQNGVETPDGGVGVWLDVPMIDLLHGKGTIEAEFPGKFHEFLRLGMDLRQLPVLVFPTLHYQNGGVVIGPDGGTDLPGLYAAGEVVGGVHGRNRLMGNALLEAVVFGLRAGRSAANYGSDRPPVGRPGLAHLEPFLEQLQGAGVDPGRVAPILLPARRRYQREKMVSDGSSAFFH